MGQNILNFHRALRVVIFALTGAVAFFFSGCNWWGSSIPAKADNMAKKFMTAVPLYAAIHQAKRGIHYAEGGMLRCSDHRFGTNIRRCLIEGMNIESFDEEVLPGGPLALVDPLHPEDRTSALRHIAMLKKLHNFKKFVLCDHTSGCEDGCGGYLNKYPELKGAGPQAEWDKHVEILLKAGEVLKKEFPDLEEVILTIIKPEEGPDGKVVDRVYRIG